MRVLTFEASEQAKQTYGILSTAMRSGTMKGIDQTRRVNKILDKFEAVGTSRIVPVKDQAGEVVRDDDDEALTRTVWKLKDGGGVVKLEDAEFTELRQRMDSTDWLTAARDRVGAAFEFIEAAPEETKAEAEKPAKPKAKKR